MFIHAVKSLSARSDGNDTIKCFVVHFAFTTEQDQNGSSGSGEGITGSSRNGTGDEDGGGSNTTMPEDVNDTSTAALHSTCIAPAVCSAVAGWLLLLM
jgi:hypothetical protein